MAADKFSGPPNTPPYFDLICGHWADQEMQRNILLHFIEDWQLSLGFIKYLDDHFPENEDGRRERAAKKP